MNWTPLTDDIRRFILLNIPSIPYLEAMLLLRGNIEHSWTVEEVGQRLFIKNDAAAVLLKQLQAANIIIALNQSPYKYQYQPQTEDLKKTIDLLAEIYSKNLIEVTNLIHSDTKKKAEKFANAFIWRKDS